MTAVLENRDTSMVVVFGRPGAGKTTISTAALTKIQNTSNDIKASLLDLDVCVPSWMKDNFAKGIYPTLEQRNEFSITACNYIDEEINTMRKNITNDDDGDDNGNGTQQPLFIIISFSFVNTDLRDNFRSRFPHAKWALVDVDDSTAKERIDNRTDHFYKGSPSPPSATKKSEHDSSSSPKKGENENEDEGSKNDKNSEWNFSPVGFAHLILNGSLPIQQNAECVIKMLMKSS